MNIRRHIPNAITSMNLLLGVIGVTVASLPDMEAAFCCMICAAICDFLDGFAARMLGAYSPMGKELDSLSDVVSFGVLPAIMMFHIGNSSNHVISMIPFLIAVFSGLRLAKFNLDIRQHESFLGLPTPACAMVCGSLACYISKEQWFFIQDTFGEFGIPAISIILCVLLVSNIPMFAFKISKGRKLERSLKIKLGIFFAVALLSVVFTIVYKKHWSLIFLVTFTSYILINLVSAIKKPSSAAE